MIVVDASVTAKLLIDEVDSARAKDWFLDNAGHLIAPDLLAIEVTQAVVRRVNMRQISRPTGRRAIREWSAFLEEGEVVLTRSEPAQVEAAAGLAIELGHPVKDCVYLALALQRDCALVTSDARFCEKAQAAYPRITLFADFS